MQTTKWVYCIGNSWGKIRNISNELTQMKVSRMDELFSIVHNGSKKAGQWSLFTKNIVSNTRFFTTPSRVIDLSNLEPSWECSNYYLIYYGCDSWVLVTNPKISILKYMFTEQFSFYFHVTILCTCVCELFATSYIASAKECYQFCFIYMTFFLEISYL